MAYAEIGDEDMYDAKIDNTYRTAETWQDIGSYRDEKGYLRYGIIPTSNQPVFKSNNKWTIKTD
jgi:hypothetical protein